MPDGNISTLANVFDPDETPAPDPSPQGEGEVERMLEALLFAAAEPLSVKDLASRLPNGVDIPAGMSALADRYATREACSWSRSRGAGGSRRRMIWPS